MKTRLKRSQPSDSRNFSRDPDLVSSIPLFLRFGLPLYLLLEIPCISNSVSGTPYKSSPSSPSCYRICRSSRLRHKDNRLWALLLEGSRSAPERSWSLSTSRSKIRTATLFTASSARTSPSPRVSSRRSSRTSKSTPVRRSYKPARSCHRCRPAPSVTTRPCPPAAHSTSCCSTCSTLRWRTSPTSATSCSSTSRRPGPARASPSSGFQRGSSCCKALAPTRRC